MMVLLRLSYMKHLRYEIIGPPLKIKSPLTMLLKSPRLKKGKEGKIKMLMNFRKSMMSTYES